MVNELSLSSFLSIPVHCLEHGTVRVDVMPFTVLFPVFPLTFKSLPIRIVKDAKTSAIIITELPFIHLTIRPKVFSKSVLLVSVPFPFINPPVRPIKESLPMHRIFLKEPLVYFHLTRYRSAIPIAQSIFEVSLVYRLASFEYFKAFTVWTAASNQYLSTVLGPTLALLELNLLFPGIQYLVQLFLLFFVVKVRRNVRRRVLEEIQRAQQLVSLSYFWVFQIVNNVIIIILRKLIIQFNDICVECCF